MGLCVLSPPKKKIYTCPTRVHTKQQQPPSQQQQN